MDIEQNQAIINETVYNYEILLREFGDRLRKLENHIINCQNEIYNNKKTLINILDIIQKKGD